MIKYLAAGLILTFLVFLVAGAKLWMASNDSSNLSKQASGSVQLSEENNKFSSGEIAQPSLLEASSPGSDMLLGAQLEAESNQNKSLSTSMDGTSFVALPWSESDQFDTIPEKFLRKGLNPRALKISQAVLQSLTTGDEISLSIPQLGQNYTMDVKQVRRYNNGDRTVKGHLKNTDLPYSVIITTDNNSSYATINTPDGAYLMEATGNKGWTTAIASLDYLIDTNLDDFQIPDINRELN